MIVISVVPLFESISRKFPFLLIIRISRLKQLNLKQSLDRLFSPNDGMFMAWVMTFLWTVEQFRHIMVFLVQGFLANFIPCLGGALFLKLIKTWVKSSNNILIYIKASIIVNINVDIKIFRKGIKMKKIIKIKKM